MTLDDSIVNRFYFDFDGTLVSSNLFKEVTISESIRDVCGLNQQSEDAISYFVSNHGVARLVKLQKFFDHEEISEILARYNGKCTAYFNTCRVNHYLKIAILKLYHRGSSLYVLSGGNSAEIRTCLDYNGISFCFQEILADENSKLNHLKTLNADKHDLVIGDSLYDYECAQKCKVSFASIIINDHNQLFELSKKVSNYSSIKFMTALDFLQFATL